MRRTAAVVILIISLILVLPAIAGPLEDATRAYFQGDYKTAFRLFKPLADKGNVPAQVAIGIMYRDGEGVPSDYVEAAKWYRKAAERGDSTAQSHLGLMYESG